MMNVKKVIEEISIGTVQIVPESELEKKLQKGVPLRVKLGMDPTAPDLHLGHAVVLGKMRQLQDLGHHAILVIGDFTARIGDPTGRSKTRPPLTDEDIAINCKTYFDQVGRILDLTNLTVRYNSEWLNALDAKEMVQLCAKVTLARIIEREDFQNRMKEHQPIGFHELLYPLFQGYDSVALQADIELGGTDQTFNLLMGRYLQEQFGQEPQVVMTVPLLEGLDGGPKMSKSLGNAISITESADQAFGRLMSISDQLMWHYMHVLLRLKHDEIAALQERVASGSLHPMDCKKHMAHTIIARYWGGKEVADAAQKQFEAVFQQKDYSKAQEVDLLEEFSQPCWLVDLLKRLGAVSSSSEAKRLIESGSIVIDDQPIRDFKAEIKLISGMVIKAGKHRIYRVK